MKPASGPACTPATLPRDIVNILSLHLLIHAIWLKFLLLWVPILLFWFPIHRRFPVHGLWLPIWDWLPTLTQPFLLLIQAAWLPIQTFFVTDSLSDRNPGAVQCLSVWPSTEFSTVDSIQRKYKKGARTGWPLACLLGMAESAVSCLKGTDQHVEP